MEPTWGPLWSESLQRNLPVFAATMPEAGYICGNFTLADICAAYVLRIGVQSGLLQMEGMLAAYLRRLMERPAARAARFFGGLDP